MSKQDEMKVVNAKRAGLSEQATKAYLSGRVSLGNAKQFAEKANKGKGFK